MRTDSYLLSFSVTGTTTTYPLDLGCARGDKITGVRFDGYIQTAGGSGVSRLLVSTCGKTAAMVGNGVAYPGVVFGLYRQHPAAGDPLTVDAESPNLDYPLDDGSIITVSITSDADITLVGWLVLTIGRKG